MTIGVASGARGTRPLSLSKKYESNMAAEWQEISVHFRSLWILVEEVLRSGVQIQGVT